MSPVAAQVLSSFPMSPCLHVHKGEYAPGLHDLPILAIIEPLFVSHNAFQRGHQQQQPWCKVRTCTSSKVWTGVLNIENLL